MADVGERFSLAFPGSRALGAINLNPHAERLQRKKDARQSSEGAGGLYARRDAARQGSGRAGLKRSREPTGGADLHSSREAIVQHNNKRSSLQYTGVAGHPFGGTDATGLSVSSGDGSQASLWIPLHVSGAAGAQLGLRIPLHFRGGAGVSDSLSREAKSRSDPKASLNHGWRTGCQSGAATRATFNRNDGAAYKAASPRQVPVEASFLHQSQEPVILGPHCRKIRPEKPIADQQTGRAEAYATSPSPNVRATAQASGIPALIHRPQNETPPPSLPGTAERPIDLLSTSSPSTPGSTPGSSTPGSSTPGSSTPGSWTSRSELSEDFRALASGRNPTPAHTLHPHDPYPSILRQQINALALTRPQLGREYAIQGRNSNPSSLMDEDARHLTALREELRTIKPIQTEAELIQVTGKSNPEYHEEIQKVLDQPNVYGRRGHLQILTQELRELVRNWGEDEPEIDYWELATQYRRVIIELRRRVVEEDTGQGSGWQAQGAGREGGRAGGRG